MTLRVTFLNVYKKLHATHGPQDWWPGDSAFEIMVGAVLTQNTAWTNVEKAIANLKRARALTPQKILRNSQNHPYLAANRLGCMYSGARIAIPLLEIILVVALTAG